VKYRYSIIIPCYNEENTVFEVVDAICTKFSESNVIVVDDGSTDSSFNEMTKVTHKNLYALKHEENMGKGAAMRTGLQNIKPGTDVVIFTDADKEILIGDITRVVNYYEKNNVEAVFGSRFVEMNLNKKFQMGLHRYIANKILTMLINAICRQKLTDMETAVKSFKSNIIDNLNLKSNGFDIEPEIVKALSKERITIHEVPINYEPRTSSEGKKISFKDGVITLGYILKKY
jgi:glycosyltransferase involved in cell wall biosynthesis